MKTKEDLLKAINQVINSKSSKISKRDLEKLIVIRERIKVSKSKLSLTKLLGHLIKLIGIGSKYFHDN
jgi:hypothetical protein